ncbi:hypothetical protein D3C80_1647710 [compost metagenome]
MVDLGFRLRLYNKIVSQCFQPFVIDNLCQLIVEIRKAANKLLACGAVLFDNHFLQHRLKPGQFLDGGKDIVVLQVIFDQRFQRVDDFLIGELA